MGWAMADESREPAQRISTSLETLRTEIRLANAELELRIIDKVATKEAVNKVEQKIATLETQLEALEKDKAGREAVASMTRYFIGGGVLTTLIMICQLCLTFYLTTRGG